MKLTHSVCEECWRLMTNGCDPHRVKYPPRDICCFCGSENWSGIYIGYYKELKCKGVHEKITAK